MPRKITSFADKVKSERHVEYCPKCSGEIEHILQVTPFRSSTGAWKFKQKHIGVCKCNHDEIYK